MQVECSRIIKLMQSVTQEELVFAERAIQDLRPVNFDSETNEIDASTVLALLPRSIRLVINRIHHYIHDVMNHSQTITNKKQKVIDLDYLIPFLCEYVPEEIELLQIPILAKFKYVCELLDNQPFNTIDDVMDTIISPLKNFIAALYSKRHELLGILDLDMKIDEIYKGEVKKRLISVGYEGIQKRLIDNSETIEKVDEVDNEKVTEKAVEIKRSLFAERKRLLDEQEVIRHRAHLSELHRQMKNARDGLYIEENEKEFAETMLLREKIITTEKLLNDKETLLAACAQCKIELQAIIKREFEKTNSKMAEKVMLTMPAFKFGRDTEMLYESGYSAMAREVYQFHCNDKNSNEINNKNWKNLLQYYALDKMEQTLTDAKFADVSFQIQSFRHVFLDMQPFFPMHFDSPIKRFIKKVLDVLSFGHFNQNYWQQPPDTKLVAKVKSTLFAQGNVIPESAIKNLTMEREKRNSIEMRVPNRSPS